MYLRTNVSSINAQRHLGGAVSELSGSREKLASGLRINRAADDAAGLSIASSLRADVRLATTAIRNTNDALSMLDIADGAMEQLASILTRGAELADQAANGVYSREQRENLHREAVAIVAEIDRIAATTQFNNLLILQTGGDPLASDKLAILLGLQTAWLEQSEILIQTYYGLSGDGASFHVEFVNNAAQYLAAVSGQAAGDGTVVNQRLIIDIADFTPATLPNGGNAPYYNDRIIAHEMVHAIMGRTMNFTALPTWFIEGTAEFIHGADERVAGDLAVAGGDASVIIDDIDQPWSGTSRQYSAGYVAVRYLHSRIITEGGTGIRDVMDYLQANPSQDLNAALQNIGTASYTGLNGPGGFYEDFKTGGAGVAFLNGMDLSNSDTGAIGGGDADGGGRNTTATAVVPDTENYTDDPLSGFTEIFPEIDNSNGEIIFAVGVNGRDYLALKLLNISAENLGVASVNLVDDPRGALDAFRAGIQTLNIERGKIGATQSRFETIINNLRVMGENYSASQSRIMDVDVAEEAGSVARANIRVQAATAVLAQANVQGRLALDLLKF